MLDQEAKEKLLAKIEEAAQEAEDLYSQYANAVGRGSKVSQANSYENLREAVALCRQINGLLKAENHASSRLEKIIKAFDALEDPGLEEFRTLES